MIYTVLYSVCTSENHHDRQDVEATFELLPSKASDTSDTLARKDLSKVAIAGFTCFQINMSRPRPIHQPPREIRSQPDEAEPSYSYEQESFLLGAREEAYEDDFHRRLQSTRRDTGGSFWRTSSNSGDFPGPNFSSMSMKQRQDSIASTTTERKTSLAALQQVQSPEHLDPSVSVNSS